MNDSAQTNNVRSAVTARSGARTPSGPKGRFLVGSMFEFSRSALDFITMVAHDYGPVARYRVANVTFYQISHPDGVQRVLQEKYHSYVKGKLFDILRNTGGDGLFTSEGSFWLRQRRLMQPAFHRQRIATFAEIMTGETLDMLSRWTARQADDLPIDVSQEMTDLTMAIVTRALFGTQFRDPSHHVSRSISTLLEDINFRFEVPFYPSVRIPTPRNLRVRKAIRVLDRVVYEIIESRRRRETQADDLLSMLMDAQDEDTGEAMSDKQLRDEVLTIFVAGHETTAVALTWAFHLLSEHPDVETRLRAEIEEALDGRTPTMSDLPNLVYTRMVIDETLRLYPPAWITNRTCLEADEICGYRVPAGAYVAISPYVTHRLPEFWDHPERFDPERFSEARSEGRHRYAYLPFGAGPHKCIGYSFALMEAQLLLATILQHYRLKSLPEHHVVPSPHTTLRPAGGLPMILEQVS